MIIKGLKHLLHCHTSGSLLDSVSAPSEYITYAANHDLPHVCVTDHGQLSAQYELFNSAKGTGIKPLCGIEAYVKLPEHSKEVLGHLTLAAYTKEGIKNIYKLFNLSFERQSIPRWGHAKPVMHWDQLAQYSKGIFAGSGCLSGIAGKNFCKGRPDFAEQNIMKLIEIYGKENVYAEFISASASWEWERKTRTFIPNPCTTWSNGESDYNKAYQLWLYEIGVKKLGLKPVVNTDSHFIKKEEHSLQTLVLQAAEGGWSFHDSMHIFSKEEIYNALSYLPGHGPKLHDEMITNGFDFASRVEYEGHLTGPEVKLPLSFANEHEETSALLAAIKMDRLL